MILDSGNRTQFYDDNGNELGVRDIQEGKGRCDLLPLVEVGEWLNDSIIVAIGRFMESGDIEFLHTALDMFAIISENDTYSLALETAVHFEEGAKKYGERNWEKGIQAHCYVSSAIRHYIKYMRGDDDENHNRAFVWNILCLMHTINHRPELNDLPFAKKVEKC